MIHFTRRLIILSLILGMNLLYANINTIVSILPQKTFVEAIGGEKVNVSVMVKPGSTPHSYEPKPSQMTQIGNADIYFAIGVEFEKAWLSRFSDQNKKMKVVRIDSGIHKIEIDEHHHHNDHGHDAHHDEHGHDEDHDDHGHDAHHHEEKEVCTAEKDPHIWTSPKNVKLMAKNIYDQLVTSDKANEAYYRSNYDTFIAHIEETDQKIKSILDKKKTNRKFIVFHPSWGYFAKDYGLTQIAIEVGGKNPKPKQIMHLIKEARAQKVHAIFTAPEFSEETAHIIAKEVGVPVVKISPLAPNWSENLIKFAKTIVQN